jgi:formyl-CoA transferase
MSVSAALCGAKFYPLHDRKNPPNAIFNVYRSSDDQWFLIIVQDKDWPALATGIGHAELLTDDRFTDKARAANSAQLAEILDKVFLSQPWAHWRDALNHARITFGLVRNPVDTVTDPQLLENDIIVPLEGAGEKLKFTVSSPLKVHDVQKVPARRAPELGEHNDELLKELGFTQNDIVGFRSSGTIPNILQEVTGGVR